MRQMNLATETGCGWDRIVAESERCGMPAPLPEIDEDTTRVVMLSPRALTDMDYSTRIWSVYQHACLKFANREHLTNGSLRERFGIELKNSAIASRLIKEAVEAKVIVPYQAELVESTCVIFPTGLILIKTALFDGYLIVLPNTSVLSPTIVFELHIQRYRFSEDIGMFEYRKKKKASYVD